MMLSKRNLSPAPQSFMALTLAALGIVYGDIGTSPLYAMRVCLEGLPIDLSHVLGVLSLIVWSLTLLISTKYLFVLFQADNDGEGGVLALLASIHSKHRGLQLLVGGMGILGAGLMLGDGMLTPAISILSAMEGINLIWPGLSEGVIPLTCLILVILFSLQSLGTAKIGVMFGPILLLWFIVIALLGLIHVMDRPEVLLALNPYYAMHFMVEMGWKGYCILGGVFLVVTGGEALYADLGHFGKAPIRLSWFFLVFPALVMNYLGQGAYLLDHPGALMNPFYCLAPGWFTIPLLVLATLATIIASQAVISAIFSLTKQSILLGFLPKMPIIQTSNSHMGQIYVPKVNMILAAGTFILIDGFRSSNAMTHAYGIAVNLVMLLSLILVAYVSWEKWRFGWLKSLVLVAIFGTIDVTFFGSNLLKLTTGGWVPLLIAVTSAFVMITWSQGRLYLQQTYYGKEQDLTRMHDMLTDDRNVPLTGITAVFITDIYDQSGGGFFSFLTLTHMIPERLILVNYSVETVPYVSPSKRFKLSRLTERAYQLTLCYGFMDTVSIPQALYVMNDRGLLPFQVDVEHVVYFLEMPYIIPSSSNIKVLPIWGQEWLFALLVRNYSTHLGVAFYQLPNDRTIAMGSYYVV